MTISRRWQLACAAGLGLGLSATTGCQTHIIGTGMTLPSPHYLEHPPQYFPPDPTFPLQRERDSMLDPDGAIRRGVAGPLPAVPGPLGAPAPAGVPPVPAGPGLPPLNPAQPQLPPGAGAGPGVTPEGK